MNVKERLGLYGLVALCVVFLCGICACQAFMRLMHGACPTRCGGWKVHVGRYAVEGGVEDAFCCSNAEDWLDCESGCQWYERMFVPNAAIEAEAHLYMMQRLGGGTSF